MAKESKDCWDIFDIVVNKAILVIIPIVIGCVGNNISQSLERAKLVDSLLDDLVTKDNRQDIALIALDSAIPEPKEVRSLL